MGSTYLATGKSDRNSFFAHVKKPTFYWLKPEDKNPERLKISLFLDPRTVVQQKALGSSDIFLMTPLLASDNEVSRLQSRTIQIGWDQNPLKIVFEAGTKLDPNRRLKCRFLDARQFNDISRIALPGITAGVYVKVRQMSVR